MAKRVIVWSEHAKFDLVEIFEYFNFKYKSKSHSLKLNQTIQTEIAILIDNTEIGKPTNVDGVRGLLIESYWFFYEVNALHIVIVSVWDTRQNPFNQKYF